MIKHPMFNPYDFQFTFPRMTKDYSALIRNELILRLKPFELLSNAEMLLSDPDLVDLLLDETQEYIDTYVLKILEEKRITR